MSQKIKRKITLRNMRIGRMGKKMDYSITTRKGDEGMTSLLDGSRVKKDSFRPEAFGTIDEANAFMGAFRATTTVDRIRGIIVTVQNHLYFINSELACPPEKLGLLRRKIGEADLGFLDKLIDKLEGELVLPREFVLYGGTIGSAYADIARTIIRRSERHVVTLDSVDPLENPFIKKYLNRLSDLLFLLARLEERTAGIQPLHPKKDLE
jgi:cob(I)alamin adenosyltransferase